MRRVVRLLNVPAYSFLGLELGDGQYEDEMLQNLDGYIPEQPFSTPAPELLRSCAYIVIMTGALGEPDTAMVKHMQPHVNRAYPKALQLHPIGRLVPVQAPQPKPQATAAVRDLRPVRSGQAYSILSPSPDGLVIPDVAEALETVFEHFARNRGFTREKPLEIRLSRGFKANSYGHGECRAVDIASVGGKNLLIWKQQWDRAMADAEKLSEPQQRAGAIKTEQENNLGYGLYKTLQEHGGWRVNPKGWRTYRGVMQLFGPWTATEGPWKAMRINSPNEYQRLRLADQQWVFQAHRDHIHVAR